MAFELAPLPYAYDSLQPYMSAETLEYHHDKHHKAYVDNLNKLIEGTDYAGKDLETIIKESFAGKDAGVFNNAAQDFNPHPFLALDDQGRQRQKSAGRNPGADRPRPWGLPAGFRADFLQAGATRFGSGWAWLAINKDGKLEVTKTPNGENPLVHGGWPLLDACVGALLAHRLPQRRGRNTLKLGSTTSSTGPMSKSFTHSRPSSRRERYCRSLKRASLGPPVSLDAFVYF